MSGFGDFPPGTDGVSKLNTNTEVTSRSCGFSCVCIHANDFEASSTFYSRVLGLKEIQDQTLRSGDTRLFEFSNGFRLQIVGGHAELNSSGGHHFMICSPDFDATIKFLIVNGIHWGARDGELRKVAVRPDGVRQIFLHDPDYNLIEINDEPPTGLVPFSPTWFLPPGAYQT